MNGRVPEGLIGRERRFVPRPWILDRVAGWLDGGPERVFLLTGDAGTGKSVISGWLGAEPDPPAPEAALQHVREAWDAVFFCGQRYVGSSPDPWTFLQEVCTQLCVSVPGFRAAVEEVYRPLIHGTATAGTVTDGTVTGVHVNQLVLKGMTIAEAYQKALESPLRIVLDAEPAPRVALMIDGLDEAVANGRDSIGTLAASLARLRGALRLFVTSQNDRGVTRDLRSLEGTAVLHVDLSSPEPAGDVEADLDRYVRANVGDAALSVVALRRIRKAAAGSFLYAQGMLDDPNRAEHDLPSDLGRAQHLQLERLLMRHFGEGWRGEWAGSLAAYFALLAVLRAPVAVDVLGAWMRESKAEARLEADRFQSLLRERHGTVILSHPAWAELLLAPEIGGGEPNRFQVDAGAAHRRIVDFYVGADTPTWDDYGLQHLPAHLAGLQGEGSPGEEYASLVDAVVALLLEPHFAEQLRRRVPDPVAAGRPYRTLCALLLDLGRSELLERLVRHTANAKEAATRVAAFEGLLGYAALAPEPARRLIAGLALSDAPRGRLVALRATSRLPRDDQTAVLRDVVTEGDHATRMAAAYAVYAGWSTEPHQLTAEVLTDLADTVSYRRPKGSVATLEFLANATITTYINHCSDRRVAELTSELWHRVLVGRLRVNLINRPFLERTMITPFMARHFSARVTEATIGFDRVDAATLLPLRGPDADAVRAVVELLDPAADLARAEDELARLLGAEVVLFRILAAEALAVHASADFESARPVIERLLKGGSVRQRTTMLLAFTLLLPDAPAGWLALVERMTEALAAEDRPPFAPGQDTLLSALDIFFVPLGLAYGKAGAPLAMHASLLAAAATAPDVRRSCITGVGVVGLYFPDAALAALEPAVEADARFLGTHGVAALGLMASLHPAAVDHWLQRWDAFDLWDAVLAASELDSAHRYVESIGLYTNGVHQALHYPFMRTELLMSVFSLMLSSASEKEWVREYASKVLAALRTADYTLLNWTR